jgi:hypothetical protein
MSYSPMLVLHICSGTVGLLSGGVAMGLRKGSERHRLAGNVFVVSMLSLGISGALLAALKGQMGNFMGGVFTVYLVTTAWLAGRRQHHQPNMLDWAALAVVTSIALSNAILGIQAMHAPTGIRFGQPAGPYFFVATITSLAAMGDVRMLLRGGLSGKQRLVRHLWRMCFGWFGASASIFLARPHLFPVVMRTTHLLLLLGVLPLLFMIFWLIRVRFAGAYDRQRVARLAVARGLTPR